jgi:hypothetical protein
MRVIVGISLLLLGVGTLSCRQVARHDGNVRQVAFKWVRTVDGWERPAWWEVSPIETPHLHPLVVATGQGLVSVLALVAFRREDE